jgi:hypothetical protein
MSETAPIKSVADIFSRWPGIAEHNVEHAADFIEFHLSEGGEHIDGIIEDLEEPGADLLFSLTRSASWRLRHDPERTREDILQAAAEAIFTYEERRAVEALQSGDEKLGERSVQELFGKWPVELAIRYSPSPLFPEGRQVYVPLDISDGKKPDIPQRTEYVVDCYGQKVGVTQEISEYVNRYRDSEPTEEDVRNIQMLAENSLSFDQHEYQRLRETYGTKAATLFVLDRAIAALKSETEGISGVASFEVPPFTAAPVDLHKMYRDGDERYEGFLEKIRQQAVGVTNDRFDPELYRPLVVVRSSAVRSEDGDNVSGAGVYASVSADPRNPKSFREAVEAVFNSMETEEAKAYRKANGIYEEQMGLLIQRYIEDTKDYEDTCVYGYVQSSDPFGRFVNLSSETGELLFDRKAVKDRFMIAPPYGRTQPTFHYNPDHDTPISNFSRECALLANAALFAEKLFSKQVEVEFALDDSNTAYVVQVRPLPHQEKPEEVTFPTDTEPIVECRAIGVGDVIVTVRDDDDEYEPNEHMFDWVDNESGTGRTLHRRDERAVFVIGFNNAYSGHIQMLAREGGQMCLYPNALTALPLGLSDQILPNRQQSRVRKFRVVADGYRGAIYPHDEERKMLLQNLARLISAYALKKEAEG